MPSRIAIGTAQFGLPYGVANNSGQISRDVAAGILEHAWNSGVDMLDTAVAYGESEIRLGDLGVRQWKVVTKLPALPEKCPDISAWVFNTVSASLQRLNIERLYGLLMHNPSQLSSRQGPGLYKALLGVKDQGLVSNIGVSIYDPIELETICNQYDVDIVQAPLNIVDRRLITSGWMVKLHDRGIEVHARSIFLQGLLLMTYGSRNPAFDRWASLWQNWRDWLRVENLTPLQACLGFVLAHAEISRVVVGIDSLAHFQEILTTADYKVADTPNDLACNDINLINPSRWTLK